MRSQKQLLDAYVQAVFAAPQSLGLTAAPTAAEFWERHVLDALKIVELIPPRLQNASLKAIDVGSGNGIPGIPAAIALPKWDIILLDSNSKKCGFLDMFLKFNAINNVRVIANRAEILGHDQSYREQFDLAFARALGKLPSAVELAFPFLKIGGLLVVPHGGSHKTELARSARALKELGGIHQGSDAYEIRRDVSFMALTFLKQKATPEKYPRNTGIPTKRPL